MTKAVDMHNFTSYTGRRIQEFALGCR